MDAQHGKIILESPPEVDLMWRAINSYLKQHKNDDAFKQKEREMLENLMAKLQVMYLSWDE